MTNINGWACFFLVSLRLVIGWHFFIEGVYKIHTHRIGKTATNTPWSGEGFFREGYGPLAEPARNSLRIDPQSDLERFPVGRWGIRDAGMSDIQSSDWDGYFEKFSTHYLLSADQKAKAEDLFRSKVRDAYSWLRGSIATKVKSNVAWGVVERPMTVSERIANINASLAEISDIQSKMRPAFGSEVEKTQLRSLKVETAKQIAELNADYDARVADMRAALESILTEEQKKRGPILVETLRKPIIVVDQLTMWSMAALGLCLLLGLFSRIASFCLALFLLSVTFIAPALPFAPTPPGAIGHYVYINLYTIEMIALLVLTVIPTGRWFGLDALFSSIRGRRKPALAESPLSIPVRLQR